jgi:hypothetical protein
MTTDNFDNFDEFDNFEEFENFLNNSADQEMETEDFHGQEHDDTFTDEERKKIEENSKKHKSEKKKFMDTGGSKGEGGEGKPGEEEQNADGSPKRALIVVTGEGITAEDLKQLTSMIGEKGAAELKKEIEKAIAGNKESKPSDEEIEQLEKFYEYVKGILTTIMREDARSIVNYLTFAIMDYESKVVNPDKTSLHVFSEVTELLYFRKILTNLANVMQDIAESKDAMKNLDEAGVTCIELAVAETSKRIVQNHWEYLSIQKSKDLNQTEKNKLPNVKTTFLKLDAFLGRNS